MRIKAKKETNSIVSKYPKQSLAFPKNSYPEFQSKADETPSQRGSDSKVKGSHTRVTSNLWMLRLEM